MMACLTHRTWVDHFISLSCPRTEGFAVGKSSRHWTCAGTRTLRGHAASFAHSDGREILEPVLGLHEILHLWAQRAGINIMRHHQEQRVIDEFLVNLLQHGSLLLRIESVADLVEQTVHVRVAVMSPIGSCRRLQVTLHVPDE